MIWLTEEDERLLLEMEGEISQEKLLENWRRFMELTPIPSGSPQEEQAIQFLKSKLEEYGLHPKVLRYDAYISMPKRALLEVLTPKYLEVRCTPYRQVGTTGTKGVEADVVYIPPEEIGLTECREKIVLADQETTADWMGLRDGLLLRLQEMGVEGLIVIEQDSFMSNVVHQRADFSVSGNPTSDNVHLIQRISAIVHVSNKDGQRLKTLVKQGGMRARITSIVETGWKTLPLLVAEIKSAQDQDRFLLVNSHIDTPPFSPGATDNASGDVSILELARILNGHRERLGRNVRLAYWTGHEIGRYSGSTWYNDAFWHELRYGCIGFLNIDSPGAEGATTYRAAPIGEVQDLAVESIKAATGFEVEGLRWPTRAGDSSFWGTGLPHASVTSARPKELYDPFVNYSGGGWWWHTPWATIDRGDVDILATDVKVNLNYIFRMTNCPVLPMNFTPYADAMLDRLEDLQVKSDKIRAYFNLDTVIERAKEFRMLAEELEGTVKRVIEVERPREAVEELNRCYMWVSRHINLVAHWDAEKTEQVSMETFGATPFPRIHDILKLADMPMPQAEEFKLLMTKLLRQRNFVEDGFHLANEQIKGTLLKIEKLLSLTPFSTE
jgi:hypothetical protein